MMISVAQSELVPTQQFGNATLGPVQIVGFIDNGTDEQVMESIRRLRKLCDDSIAEDRQTGPNKSGTLIPIDPLGYCVVVELEGADRRLNREERA
jgi:hypothetical protein